MNSRPGDNGARIACPKCQANNFVGHTNCWQCRAPLPPPEAIGAVGRPGPSIASRHSPPAPNQFGGSSPAALSPGRGAPSQLPQGSGFDARFLQRWGMSPGVAAVVAAVGLGMFLVVWFVAGQLRNGAGTVRSAPTAPVPITAPATPESEASRIVNDDTDPLVAESRRLIERESRHAGLPEPPTSGDGRVHLRSGGSISPDQYRDAQRHVNESPIMRTPMPPPPVP
jgi:hypothetical protein